MKSYAGIGSRKTPSPYLELITHIAQDLGSNWQLRSGGAKGADTAFANGATHKEIHLPWNSYNKLWAGRDDCIVPKITPEISSIAAAHHPNWNNLSPVVRGFMERNTTIVLGQELANYAKMVICWTPEGRLVGGTSHAMRVAYGFDIPVFNIALKEDIKRLIEFEQRTS